jgi:Tol biopolymer transport system component
LLGLTALLASACAGGDPTGETEDAAPSGRLVIADEGDLFVVNTYASGLRRLTEGPAYDMYPTWSPDGARIAFDSTRATPADFEGPARDPERTADFDVFVVDADGGEPENLSRDVQRLQKFPDWSPDGRWLAVEEEGVIAFVPADGSGPILRLAGDAVRGGFPAWAPAG